MIVVETGRRCKKLLGAFTKSTYHCGQLTAPAKAEAYIMRYVPTIRLVVSLLPGLVTRSVLGILRTGIRALPRRLLDGALATSQMCIVIGSVFTVK